MPRAGRARGRVRLVSTGAVGMFVCSRAVRPVARAFDGPCITGPSVLTDRPGTQEGDLGARPSCSI